MSFCSALRQNKPAIWAYLSIGTITPLPCNLQASYHFFGHLCSMVHCQQIRASQPSTVDILIIDKKVHREFILLGLSWRERACLPFPHFIISFLQCRAYVAMSWPPAASFTIEAFHAGRSVQNRFRERRVSKQAAGKIHCIRQIIFQQVSRQFRRPDPIHAGDRYDSL